MAASPIVFLIRCEFSLNSYFVGRTCGVGNFHRYSPHQRFDPADTGVVFPAVEKRNLDPNARGTGFECLELNTQRQLQVLGGFGDVDVVPDSPRFRR